MKILLLNIQNRSKIELRTRRKQIVRRYMAEHLEALHVSAVRMQGVLSLADPDYILDKNSAGGLSVERTIPCLAHMHRLGTPVQALQVGSCSLACHTLTGEYQTLYEEL